MRLIIEHITENTLATAQIHKRPNISQERMTVETLKGTDKRLYELVAHLVMNPDVLKQNRNYPFKTSEAFVWFVATENEEVIGFLPVEIRETNAIINNYYALDEDLKILEPMIQKASEYFHKDYILISITQNQHIQAFIPNKFVIDHEWKNYVKMRRVE